MLPCWGPACGRAPGLPGWGRPPSAHSYLHDDVKGQVEQQVTDEDPQHVGSEVPGPIDESKERAGCKENDFVGIRAVA